MQYFRETKRHGLDLGSVLFFVEKSDFLVSVTFNKKGMNESFTILIVFCRWAFGVVVWEIVTLGKNQRICH